MDINDYLSKIRQDIDRQVGEIKSRTDSILDGISGMQPRDIYRDRARLPELVKESRLEDVSKSKIGTFEQLYLATYQKETGRPLRYGYDDLDYCSLIGLLVSVLEIELNLSVYQELRRLYGVNMPEFANRPAGCKEISLGSGYSVDVGKKEQTLGPIKSLAEQRSRELERQIPECNGFVNSLSAFIAIRNKADHKEYISKDSFLSFYESYADFFNFYIGHLMDLKQEFRQSVPGTYSQPRSYAGYSNVTEEDLDYLHSLDSQAGSAGKVKHGIIFTDTAKLAMKYFGDINYIVKTEDGKERVYSYTAVVVDILQKYILECSGLGINYRLLDISSKYYGHVVNYDHILDHDSSWRGYQKVLDEYCMENGIDGTNPCGLFIIGGDDVIPMPNVHNPSSFPEKEVNSVDVGEQTLDADILYAYESRQVLLNGNNDVSLKLMSAAPRFHVGRLPLENGPLSSDIYSDLYEIDDKGNGIGGYFHRAVTAYKSGMKSDGRTFKPAGIEINCPVAVSANKAKVAMFHAAEGLPIKGIGDIPDVIENNVFLSPGVDINHSGGFTERYLDAIKEADMLIFILHGHYRANASGFYGDPGDACAFVPGLFQKTDNKVFAGICCWGARFIGYRRDNSALLSAIYGNTLLYAGASRSAYGNYGLDNRCWYAEAMLKYYTNYLFQGYDAGEALIKARIDYFRRYVQHDGPYGAFTTVLEFNLFGDPLLNLCQTLPKSDDFDNVVFKEHEDRADGGDEYLTRGFELVYSAPEEGGSLLSSIRNMVDSNFRAIHTEISDRLYRTLGIEPRTLYCAYRTTEPSGRQGYSLKYKSTEGYVEHNTIVETDLYGNIKHVYRSY